MLGEKIKNNEQGMIIVEASFVFPIMFIILFFLIYMGNAFYEKAQIEAVVEEKAIEGANYCADPLLETIMSTGGIPNISQLQTDPYRYLFGGMGEIEAKIESEVETVIEGKSSSFFKNMSPNIVTPSSEMATFNNYVVYSTFSVEVEYVVRFPISFLGKSTPPVLKICSRAEAPVNDTAEFIRNTDMVIDIFHGTKVGQSISDVFGKIEDFMDSFANM